MLRHLLLWKAICDLAACRLFVDRPLVGIISSNPGEFSLGG